jgi:hypothetical protein
MRGRVRIMRLTKLYRQCSTVASNIPCANIGHIASVQLAARDPSSGSRLCVMSPRGPSSPHQLGRVASPYLQWRICGWGPIGGATTRRDVGGRGDSLDDLADAADIRGFSRQTAKCSTYFVSYWWKALCSDWSNLFVLTRPFCIADFQRIHWIRDALRVGRPKQHIQKDDRRGDRGSPWFLAPRRCRVKKIASKFRGLTPDAANSRCATGNMIGSPKPTRSSRAGRAWRLWR